MIKTDRREFLQLMVQGSAVAACSTMGLAAMVKSAQATAWAPQPPGASERFTDRCIKCGLCVKACPYDTLRLARLGDPAPLGTPYFVPREIACYMCEDIPCARVCPSGALDRTMKDIKQARMGIAVIDPASCLSWQGLRCEVCYRICPVQDKALTLAPHPRQLSKHAVFVPTIDPHHCTGCGLCTWSCPTQKSAINILRPDSVLGKIGDHYRLGWLDEQPHNPTPPSQPQKPEKTTPGGLNFLNSMDDPTL